MNQDTFHTRRAFLNRGLALVSGSATVPYFLSRTAYAVEGLSPAGVDARQKAKPDGRILVVLQLAGGNDGLNTVVPFRNDRYYAARPRLGVKQKDVLRLNDEIGLHPEAAAFKSLYDEGLLSVVQGVGYPNPNRSHFVSTDIWSTADPTERIHNGWIGRYFDCTCAGAQRPEPKKGIAISNDAPLAMMGEKFNPVSFSNPNELTWRGPGARAGGRKAFKELNTPGQGDEMVEMPTDEASALKYLERMAMDARLSAEEIQEAAGAKGNARRRGGRGRRRGGNNQLANQLQMVRRMIGAGLETSVYYVSLGGFDTHANQKGRHQNLLRQLTTAVEGFVSGLKQDGLLERVLVMTFSEFGRRVAENGSQGTDHGAAAPMFLIGGGVQAGVHGQHPSLEPDQLDKGDLKWNVDFRQVYASVLGDWLRADSERVLAGRFKKLPIFGR